jgi:hypothetical protein
MKYYILINPFNNKPIQFSTFKDEDFDVSNIPENINSQSVIETKKALCIEINLDLSLLNKVYDPNTETFN